MREPVGKIEAELLGRWWAAYDPGLMACFALLLGFGLVMVASASITVADRDFQEPLHYFWRQLVAAGIGVSLAGIAMKSPLQYLWGAAPLFLIAPILPFVVGLLPGVGPEGKWSLTWLPLRPLSLP